MIDEMKEFALKQATEAKDLVAEELFRRATRIDLDIVNNECENVVFYFDFNGAEVNCKWNSDDRFNDPEVVYDIMLQLIYQAEDAPRPEQKKEPEPLGFVWGEDVEDPDEGAEVNEETQSLIEEYWK